MIRKGTMLVVTQGEYDSYENIGVYRVKEDFSPAATLENYLQEHPEQREDFHFNTMEFMHVLAPFLEEIEYEELSLGAYGIAPDYVNP